MQEHELAGHPKRPFCLLSCDPGISGACDYCDLCLRYFKRAVAELAARPIALKEAERA